MDRYDVESYLRQCGEDRLVHSDESDEDPLSLRARALVAVGVLDADVARQVLADYRHAAGVRGRHIHRFVDDPAEDAGPTRVVCMRRSIDAHGASVELDVVILSARGTHLVARATMPTASSSSGPPHPAMHQPPTLRVTDDTGGRAVDAHFSGGGGDDDWDGVFTTEHPLSIETTTLSVDGTVIDLTPPPTDVEVIVAERPRPTTLEERAREHLATLDEDHLGPGSGELALVIETFVAAGVLAVDSPVVTEAFEVSAARPGRQHHRLRRAHRYAAGRFVERHRYVGAATPSLDGVTVAVLSLIAGSDSARIRVVIDGAAALHRHYYHHPPQPLHRQRARFAAADDTGATYPVTLAEYSSDDDRVIGTLLIDQPLGTQAERLDLEVTVGARTATVRIPLRWES